MMDIILLAIFGVVLWSVASEGMMGACVTFFCVLFAAFLAMNFFEPVAAFLQANVASTGDWQYRWDIIALLGLFAGLIFAFSEATDYMGDVYAPVNAIVHDIGRWGVAAMTGYLTMAVLATALHTAPLPREFMGFRPERPMLFGVTAPDRQWLGFMQYATEFIFVRGQEGRLFDGPRFAPVAGQPQEIWPSFPIRYAMRREQFAQGGAVVGPAAATIAAPPQPSGSVSPEF